MKLLNQSLKYLSVSILLIVSIWSVIFYINMLDEIYDSIDDGLDNYKLLIIRKSATDPEILQKSTFDESNYAVTPISAEAAFAMTDTYQDTLHYMSFEDDQEPVRKLTSAFEQNGGYYKLEVVSSMVEEDDLISDLFWAIFWLYLILIISIVVINNLVLKKLWKPFYSFIDQLKGFNIDKGTRLPAIETKTKEFVELKKACDALITHAVESYKSQKQFTENAAHELQTPIAIIKNKLELLLENNTLENQDAASIVEVLKITERLTKLNKSLLLLSKIENKQFSDKKDISINEMAKQVADDLGDFADFRNITFNIKESDALTIQADPVLVNILISNLIKNAIYHNHEDGMVIIEILADRLIVSNTSPHSKLNDKELFKRFYKKSASHQNTGLGLAIVMAICEHGNYSIRYTHDELHSFEVIFK